MAVTLQGQSGYRLATDYRNPTSDASKEAKFSPVFSTTQQFTSGTGVSQANRFFYQEGTIVASGTASFNVLTAGALLDVYKNTLNLSRVVEVIVEHLTTSASTGTITVGGGLTPMFATLGLALKKTGGLFHFRDYSATALAITTNKELLLTNDSGTLVASYRVIIIGSQ